MLYGIIALGLLVVILFILFVRERAKSQLVVQRNSAIEEENKQLESTNQQLREEESQLNAKKEQQQSQLASLKVQVQAQNNMLQSFTATNKQLAEEAKNRAEESYNAAAASLAEEYKKRTEVLETNFQNQSSLLLARIQEEEAKLKDLEDKQLAYIQAKQREEEIEAQKDYYRLVISELDTEEIKLLRNLQIQFSRKDAIDKLIWESYYKAPYDILMSHIFESTDKVCGIYKITGLDNGQAYIGQSVDMRERFRQHIKQSLSNATPTNKLYQQMKKYGPENFTFEVLEIVDRNKLNERETYWIDFYKTKEFGMNGTRGGA